MGVSSSGEIKGTNTNFQVFFAQLLLKWIKIFKEIIRTFNLFYFMIF